MGTLLADSLQRIAGPSSTSAAPAMAVVAFAGSPTYCIAWKGHASVEAIHLSGVAPISGASSDVGPALAVSDNAYGSDTLLYLAWKIAGSGGQGVKVMQCVMGLDGFPQTQRWTGLAAEPPARTDAAPALAAGPDGALYLVWKQPGANAALAWSVYQGGVWSAAATIPDTATNDAPAAMVLAGASPVTLCLAFSGSLSQFILTASYTPGATELQLNYPVGCVTDAAPALTPGLTADTYNLVWKPQGQASLAFATVSGGMIGDVYTLPQVETDAGPAAVNWSNDTSGFGAQVFNNLILAWKGRSTGDVVQGFWSIPATTPAPSPAAGLGSWSNYFIYSDCRHLTGVKVSLVITQDMLSSNGFGFQLNCNPPSGKTCTWQQYAICIDTLGNVWGVVNNWNAEGTMILQWESNYALPTPTLTAGHTLTITLRYGPGAIVTGVTYLVELYGQPVASPLLVELDKIFLYQQPSVLASTPDFAAIVAMQMNIVGYDNQQTAKLKKGAGQIIYTADQVLTTLPTEPGCAQPTNGTGEQANTFYGALPTTGGTTLTQGFATSTEVEMIRLPKSTHFLPPRAPKAPFPDPVPPPAETGPPRRAAS